MGNSKRNSSKRTVNILMTVMLLSAVALVALMAVWIVNALPEEASGISVEGSGESGTETTAEAYTEAPETQPAFVTEEVTEPVTLPTTESITEPVTVPETQHIHSWMEATYSAPRTCILCGAAEGSPLIAPTSVEEEVLEIRQDYNAIMDAILSGTYPKIVLSDGVAAYYDQTGSIVNIVVDPGVPGIEGYSSVYERSYYFKDGELFFCFFKGEDVHRFYFYRERLMRWRYTDAGGETVNNDLTDTEAFYYWERLALNEARNLAG